MKTILGLSASKRKRGNTDILVNEALLGAKEQGARTSFVRLAELDIRPCTGCMKCLFKDSDCSLNDDFLQVVEALRQADGLVLGTPTYILGANSVLKNFVDRSIRYGMNREFAGKHGLALAVAGVEGWEPLVMAELMVPFLFMGINTVDRFIGHAQGPGEILLNVPVMLRAKRGGAELAGSNPQNLSETGMCPSCRLDYVVATKHGAKCLLCDLPGTIQNDGENRFVPDPDAKSRWSEEEMHHHFYEKVLPSGPAFKGRLKEVLGLVGDFYKKVEGSNA